jgi:hypothetical protein
MWTGGGVCVREGFGVVVRSLIESIRAARFAIEFAYCAASSDSCWDYAAKASRSH